MTTIDDDVRALCARACELGAGAARSLSARDVVGDPRVLLKCRVPLCSSYGRNLMCPPHVMSASDFAAVLQRYNHAVVVQRAIPMTAARVAREHGDKTLAELEGDETYSRTLADSQNRFDALLGTLETEALKLGHRFAAAFGGGECCLCERCVAAEGGGEGCRHPFAARPSMEAVGIDVVATARNAGLPIEMPAADEPVWTGLLLVG